VHSRPSQSRGGALYSTPSVTHLPSQPASHPAIQLEHDRLRPTSLLLRVIWIWIWIWISMPSAERRTHLAHVRAEQQARSLLPACLLPACGASNPGLRILAVALSLRGGRPCYVCMYVCVYVRSCVEYIIHTYTSDSTLLGMYIFVAAPPFLHSRPSVVHVCTGSCAADADL